RCPPGCELHRRRRSRALLGRRSRRPRAVPRRRAAAVSANRLPLGAQPREVRRAGAEALRGLLERAVEGLQVYGWGDGGCGALAGSCEVQFGQRVAFIEIDIAQNGHSFVVCATEGGYSSTALFILLISLTMTKTAAATITKVTMSLMNWPYAITGIAL